MTETTETTKIAIRKRTTGRIMATHIGDLEQVAKWYSQKVGSYADLYYPEYLARNSLPVGLPGRDEKFPEGLVITSPPIPPQRMPHKRKYPDVKTKDMTSDDLITCLRNFGPEQCIIAGELHPRVYSPEFYDELLAQIEIAKLKYSDNKLPYKVEVVAGPVAMISDDGARNGSKGTILKDLILNEDVQAYCSLTRQQEHFRLSPLAVYTEGWHAPDARGRVGLSAHYYRKYLDRYSRRRFNVLSDKGKVVECNTIEEMQDRFLFLTESELQAIARQVRKEYPKERKRFDSLTREQVEQYCESLDINL